MYRECVETYGVPKRSTERHGSKRIIISFSLRSRNLINLILRGTNTSRFSEINCITLSLAALARYLNYRSFRDCLCLSVVGISHTEGHLSAGIFKTTEPHGIARKQEDLNQQLARNMNKSQITINLSYKEVNN